MNLHTHLHREKGTTKFRHLLLYLNRVSESEKNEDFKNCSFSKIIVYQKKEYLFYEKIHFKILKDEVVVHEKFLLLGNYHHSLPVVE